MNTLETLKAAPGARVAENLGFTGAYIDWLRTDFAQGRWSADPDQPCLLYKIYQGAERVLLDGDIPLQLGKDFEANWGDVPHVRQARPEQKLSWLLYFTHGLTRRVRPVAGKAHSLGGKKQHAAPLRSGHVTGPTAHFSPTLGRPVPSGGNLHPVEMYLAVNEDWGLQAGIYHYDSAHHSLDLLRAGNFLSTIAACLPGGKPTSTAVVLLSNYLQKNHQKYTYLSYLLQTLDTGIALEQLHFVASRLGLSPEAHLCFLDRPLHALLGLNPTEELLYAILPLSQDQRAILSPEAGQAEPSKPAQGLFDFDPLVARPVQPFLPGHPAPLLQGLYAASLLDTLPEMLPSSSGSSEASEGGATLAEVVLPDALSLPRDHDIAQTLLRRHTSSQSIDTRALTIEQLAAILQSPGKLERPLWQLFDCQIYCVVSRVSSLAPDVYVYSRERHTLKPLSTPLLIPLLIRLSVGSNIQPYVPPVLLFVCGNYQKSYMAYGERGLRLLGIEIGRMVQHISLCAVHCGLGTHVHVSTTLDSIRTRLLRNSTEANLPLATVMIGHMRNAEENLFEMLWY
jgi:SagB-type dehydrogenase family enzyme